MGINIQPIRQGTYGEHKTIKRYARHPDRWFARLLVAPAMLAVIAFLIVPIIFSIHVALHYVDLTYTGPKAWMPTGLDNFRDVFSNARFWRSVVVTLAFTTTTVVVEFVLGFGVAHLLNHVTRGKGIIRSLLMLPLATAPVVTGLFWRNLFDTQFGLFNYILGFFGIQPLNWLGDVNLGLFSLIIFDIWAWTPFVALIVLAGLQSLPNDPFEAAIIDGAGPGQIFRHLTLPMLRPILILVVSFRTIDSMRLYDPIYVLTRGGPGTSTETLSYHLYRVGLDFFRMDQASAMALVFNFVLLLVGVILLRPLYKEVFTRGSIR